MWCEDDIRVEVVEQRMRVRVKSGESEGLIPTTHLGVNDRPLQEEEIGEEW